MIANLCFFHKQFTCAAINTDRFVWDVSLTHEMKIVVYEPDSTSFQDLALHLSRILPNTANGVVKSPTCPSELSRPVASDPLAQDAQERQAQAETLPNRIDFASPPFYIELVQGELCDAFLGQKRRIVEQSRSTEGRRLPARLGAVGIVIPISYVGLGPYFPLAVKSLEKMLGWEPGDRLGAALEDALNTAISTKGLKNGFGRPFLCVGSTVMVPLDDCASVVAVFSVLHYEDFEVCASNAVRGSLFGTLTCVRESPVPITTLMVPSIGNNFRHQVCAGEFAQQFAGALKVFGDRILGQTRLTSDDARWTMAVQDPQILKKRAECNPPPPPSLGLVGSKNKDDSDSDQDCVAIRF